MPARFSLPSTLHFNFIFFYFFVFFKTQINRNPFGILFQLFIQMLFPLAFDLCLGVGHQYNIEMISCLLFFFCNSQWIVLSLGWFCFPLNNDIFVTIYSYIFHFLYLLAFIVDIFRRLINCYVCNVPSHI